MRREIQRVEPWSAVRIGFFIGLLGGFVFGLLNGAMIKYVAGVLGDKLMPADLASVANLSGGALVALSIVMSLMSSLVFALMGFLAAICYNLIAHLFGGLEIHVAGEDDAASDAGSARPDDEEESDHP